jgi:Holliday junction resolvase-like predicted endonuclease
LHAQIEGRSFKLKDVHGGFLGLFGGNGLPIELSVILALLRMTTNCSALVEDVKRNSRVASSVFEATLRKLEQEGAINLGHDVVQVEATMRMRLAIKALSMGADIESMSRLLRWQEFEEISGVVLAYNGYIVERNVRFTHCSSRMEIDVVGCRDPIVVCVDCKHWQRALSTSSLNRVVEAQIKRTRALADSLPVVSSKLVCQNWNRGRFVPVVLSLVPGANVFHQNVPIVSVLQFQDFLSQLPFNIVALKHFDRTLCHLGHVSRDWAFRNAESGHKTNNEYSHQG